MVHDDDTGSDPDFDIDSTDRTTEFDELRIPISGHIRAEIYEKALRGGWDAERIREHLRRVFNTHIPVETIRSIVDQARRSQ
jgi:hypothetical protein